MPFGIAASADGKIFVADWSGNSIAEIDASTGKLERTVTVGRAPALLALTADGKRLVAANRESDSVSVIDTKDFTVKATIGVGRAPFAVGVSPDGSRALVGNVQGGTASLIDLERFQVIATERTGAGPYGVAFAPDGAPALVVNQESGTVAFVGSDLTRAGCSSQSRELSRGRRHHERRSQGLCRQLVLGRHFGHRPGGGKGDRPHQVRARSTRDIGASDHSQR